MTAQPSRRTILSAGALGAGAVAFGGLSFDEALATSASAATGSGAGTVEAPLGLGGVAALPPTIPGARTAVLGFQNAVPFAVGASAEMAWQSGMYLTTAGLLDMPIEVEPGSTILRIDVYANRTASGNVGVNVLRGHPAVSGGGATITTITTATGTGILQGSYTTPISVDAGDKIYLESSAFSSSAVTFTGAIITYFDAKPQLNLLNAPIRVYDPRPGNPPAVGTKTPIANGATRTIDCTQGGAVPVGAKAALLNVTVVNTSPAGFLALFKGGIAWPGNSTLNWDHANAVIANTTVVALDSSAHLNAYAHLGTSTDFLIDVAGFYA